MTEITQLVKKIAASFQSLNQIDIPSQKLSAIASLRQMCVMCTKLMEKDVDSIEAYRRKRQIKTILDQCNKQQEAIVHPQKESSYQIPIMNVLYNVQMENNDRMEMSRALASEIILQEVRMSQKVVPIEQLIDIQKKMHNNLAVMKDMQQFVKGQGDNIDIIEERVINIEENVIAGKEHLIKANKLQTRTLMMKIRLGVSGFLGTIGMKVGGIPGMIFGLFAGFAFWRK